LTFRGGIDLCRALPDVVTAVDILGPLVHKAGAFVLIQNGIGVESALQIHSPNSVIISGCAWVDATLLDSGKKLTQYGKVRSCVPLILPDLILSRRRG
jgi:2-dehydropantoate 2-reductase